MVKNRDNDIIGMWEGIWRSHITKLAKYHRFPPTPSIRSSHPVLNMMAQMTDIGVTWEDTPIQIPTPNILDMIQTINEGRVAESQTEIPMGFLRPLALWEIGFTELHQLAPKCGTTLLTLANPRRRYFKMLSHPDMGVKPKHATTIRKLSKHIGGRGIYGIPRDLRPRAQNRLPALLILSGWESIPAETREREDEQLRQDLEAGADLPPISMQS
jgi:hypothetical protein